MFMLKSYYCNYSINFYILCGFLTVCFLKNIIVFVVFGQIAPLHWFHTSISEMSLLQACLLAVLFNAVHNFVLCMIACRIHKKNNFPFLHEISSITIFGCICLRFQLLVGVESIQIRWLCQTDFSSNISHSQKKKVYFFIFLIGAVRDASGWIYSAKNLIMFNNICRLFLPCGPLCF